MSEGPQRITIKSDRYTQIVASTVSKGFIDKDFLMTMRFSSLYKDEEFDNALAYSTWHFLLETGISQMKDYVQRMKETLSLKKREVEQEKDPEKKKKIAIPPDQEARIQEIIKNFGMYDDSKPVDEKDNLRIIRNYLRPWNTSLGYGIIMYDMHSALLNGRYAENGGQGRKDIKEITKTILQRDYDVETTPTSARDDRGIVDKLLRKK